jgi:hypothetical protein
LRFLDPPRCPHPVRVTGVFDHTGHYGVLTGNPGGVWSRRDHAVARRPGGFDLEL